ncbi:alpha-hydroxy-acid oxidizing protein, partial [Escherichia coli]|nr:alpha-hydroxy-acid oxidizing protein [Escherichia coli]
GRAYIYALAAAGKKGVEHLLRLYAEDMKVTMTLIGASSPADISSRNLEYLEKEFSRHSSS